MLWLNLLILMLIIASCRAVKLNANKIGKNDPNPTKGLLYPFESESREIRSLDGMWRFLKTNVNVTSAHEEDWYNHDLDKVSLFCSLILNYFHGLANHS